MKKYIPNIITASRMVLSVILLMAAPMTLPFFCVYLLCGASDVLDGFVARKTDCQSPLGARLDSIADFVFCAAFLLVFIPAVKWKAWIAICICAIAIIRFANIAWGYARWHTLVMHHTILNKITGFAIFLFPFLYGIFGLDAATVAACVPAAAATLEESIIIAISHEFDADIAGIIVKRRAQ